MNTNTSRNWVRAGCILVFLMAALQLAYAIYAYLGPTGFSQVRGTTLFDAGDADWVRIYASRTLFIALLIGYLLWVRQFQALAVAALLGMIMPLTDAWLAFQAASESVVVFKHVATAVFLAVTFAVLRRIVVREAAA
jgi:hypothetical protein